MTTAPTEYGPLVQELLARAAMRGQPAAGTFELTCRCNLDCGMCYVRQPAADCARTRELEPAAWTALAREAVDAGTVFLLVTGGEVFLRPDFFDIWEPLTRLGLNLTLFTNGTLVSSDIAARLAQCPPNRIEITLYGATAATSEAITRGRGSFARCCAGVEALLSHGLPLAVKTTITRQNVADLPAMRGMARGWGVPFSASWLLSRRRDRATSNLSACRLSAEDGVTLEASDEASRCEWQQVARGPQSPASPTFSCHAGRSSFVVNPEGEMYVCQDLPLPAARPRDVGFAAAWTQLRHFVESVASGGDCGRCDLNAYCNCCPAWSLLETGELAGRPDYLCDIARLRRDRYARS